VALRRPSGTEALGGAAVGLTIGATVLEWLHLRRLREENALEAARETVEVVRTGYTAGSVRENATLNLLLSYASTALIARTLTHTIRARGTFGPIRNRSLGGRHIHHFVPGILLAFGAGAASIISRDEDLDRWLALPFGAGMALVLDEAALLVDLEDVYWTDRGVLSVQITLGTMAGLGAFTVLLRVLKRGEQQALETPAPDATP
jgi:hypothetical protein